MLATHLRQQVHCFRAQKACSPRVCRCAAFAVPRVAISSAIVTHTIKTKSNVLYHPLKRSLVSHFKRRLNVAASSSSSSATQIQASASLLPELFRNVSDFDEAAGACISEAYAAARQTHSSVSTQHLLYGLLHSSPASIKPFLTQLHELGVDADMIQQEFPEQQQRMWGDPVLDKEAAWLLAGLACGPCEQINTGKCLTKC